MIHLKNRIPLKTVAQHRYYFNVLKRARGWQRIAMLAFLALTVFNICYAMTDPAHALLYDDLTGLGRQIGGGIVDSTKQITTDIYSGKYGLWPWICKTCLWFSTPIAGVGIMQSIANDDNNPNPLPKGVFWGMVALTIALSGGGYIGGQCYLLLVAIFQGFTHKLDDFLNVSAALQAGQGFLASNSTISGYVAECEKFVGQEQAKCISVATDKALKYLGDAANEYGPMDWITGRIDVLKKIGTDIMSSDNPIASLAANTFFMFAQPVAETVASAHATASIAAISAAYGVTLAIMGLGIPVSMLASVLMPGMQSAWVGWLIGVFTAWFWYTTYLGIMWMLSLMMLTSTASNFVSTDWFTGLSAWGAPTIAGVVCGVTGISAFMGFQKSNSDLAGAVVQGAKIGVGLATGNVAGAATEIAMSGGGSSAPPVVKTEYAGSK